MRSTRSATASTLNKPKPRTTVLGGTHDTSNLQALCKSCHSAKTVRDGDRWRPKTYEYLF
ncbi:HNH endonuclease [Gleimia sp. 6138-11-ORH1]|uniref:HNH endonuclease n=1 Tax=Gleimia sp. 6138-11-ORH1 TaxID=2973937 RepID=UPI002168C490|nr:HNH endonuclease [Gleimia sp. 6138-11-ORH1]MCS4484980.1 HNH endonuclease [Gleimia sp. 6138-11-ORH1]